MSNLFDRSAEQEFTWESKHIKYFLSQKNLGRAKVKKIIEVNPDINQWDKEYVIGQLGTDMAFQLLPEEIPEIAPLEDDEVINFKDKRFPENLKNMKKDPPLLLWYKGNLNVGKGVAVVGSRNIIPETKKIVDSFVNIACNEGFNIVSGLAHGVDEQAHKVALENNSKTVAILPSSLDNILPHANKNLAYEIVENGGLLLTEYEPGSPKKPENSNYISRNRLQAGLSDAVFIAQSGIPGGTMTTAKHAIDNEISLIVYLSQNMSEEYKGNKFLTDTVDENFDYSQFKLTNNQREKIFVKKKIADYVLTASKLDIEGILSNI